jgi:RimJ/RimL family protein N-acetyltransferase
MTNPFLIGEKIYLRQIVREDAENYYQWLNGQETTKYMQRGIFPTNAEDCRRYIESMQNNGSLHLAIVRKDKEIKTNLPTEYGCHIGNITLLNIHQIFRSAEISIIIGDKQCRGNGYGTEAIRLLVDHAFIRMNLNRLQAGAAIENVGCIRAFEKAGFQREGISRQAYYCEGEYQDVAVMGLTKEDWRHSQ